MNVRRRHEPLDLSIVQVARAAAERAKETELVLMAPEQREHLGQVIMDAVIAAILVHHELYGDRERLDFSRN